MNAKRTIKAILAVAFAAICTNGYAQNSINANESAVPKEQTAIEDDNDVFFIVEKMPEFPTGEPALRKYIAENTVYPEEAKAKKIQGTVFVQFIIGKDGNVEPESVKIVRGIDPLLDAESIRVIKSLPTWTPGIQRGNPVRVSYTTTVVF